MAVYNKFAVLSFDVTIKATVHCVVLNHVNHVVKVNERIIDANDFECFRLLYSRTENETANAAKTVNANFNRHEKLPPVINCTMISYLTIL